MTRDLDQTLNRYAGLIERYHRTLDLVSDAGLRALPRHIRDGQSYARVIERECGPEAVVVDVGSGAGLPGIVIAAALPNATVHLVERRRRRTAFLGLAVANLGLHNAHVFGGDVRDLQGVCADAVTAQAVADIPTLVAISRHLHRRTCWIVSRRGDEATVPLADIWRAADLGSATVGAGAVSLSAQAKVVEEPLEERGSLVAVELPGGSACLP